MGTYNKYTMTARDFADIYTRSPRATDPRAEGVYISKSQAAMVSTNIYHSHAACFYIEGSLHFDRGILHKRDDHITR